MVTIALVRLSNEMESRSIRLVDQNKERKRKRRRFIESFRPIGKYSSNAGQSLDTGFSFVQVSSIDKKEEKPSMNDVLLFSNADGKSRLKKYKIK